MPDSPFDELIGREIDTVSFVRDYVELRIAYAIVRAITDPTGRLDGTEWRLGDAGSADLMRRYIGRTLLDAEVVDGEYISLTFDGDASIEISLRLDDRIGPEAAHYVPARTDGSLNVLGMWVW